MTNYMTRRKASVFIWVERLEEGRVAGDYACGKVGKTRKSVWRTGREGSIMIIVGILLGRRVGWGVLSYRVVDFSFRGVECDFCNDGSM